ncbi:MAG TPA: hypothetical protein VGP13_00855 [Candidatus Paceibacterota bacterium]|jgi:hypothetical protein|nr:hypothetical protein [Candidatus Paceibacterota bacterium]
MNIALRLFAGFIDLLQFLFFVVFLAFQVLTPAGGAATAGAAGAILCWNLSSGAWQSAVNAASCLVGGGVLGFGMGALGGPIGIAVDTAISCTFGLLLIICLALSGRLRFMPLLFSFTGEMTPVVNAFVPAWSILVHRCIKAHDQKLGTKATARSVLSFITGGSSAAFGIPAMAGLAAQIVAPRGKAFEDAKKKGAETPLRVPLISKSFDGIRKPANDNVQQKPYAQAA